MASGRDRSGACAGLERAARGQGPPDSGLAAFVLPGKLCHGLTSGIALGDFSALAAIQYWATSERLPLQYASKRLAASAERRFAGGVVIISSRPAAR
jgi:hypothetical protein